MKHAIEDEFMKVIPGWITQIHDKFENNKELPTEDILRLTRFSCCMVGDTRHELGLSRNYTRFDDEPCRYCCMMAEDLYVAINGDWTDKPPGQEEYLHTLQMFRRHLRHDHKKDLKK